MRKTAKELTDGQILDREAIGELVFEGNQQAAIPSSEAAPKTEGMGTDMVMLERADRWMGQFKLQLNVGIIGMVVLWVGVSYYKSSDNFNQTMEAKAPIIVADDAANSDDNKPADTLEMEGPIVPTADSKDPGSDRNATSDAALDPAQPAAPLAPKKVGAQKAGKSKTPAPKSQSKSQKKFKKSVASKPSLRS